MIEAAGEAGNVADRIAEALRERILKGELRPGSPLREVAVAAELDVSRNSLREALRLLASERLVVLVPNRGAAVGRLTAGDVRDIYRARRALEVQAAAETAIADEGQLAGMDAAVTACERAEQAGAWRAAETSSLRFHQSLVSVLGSARLDEFFRGLLVQLRLGWSETWDDERFQRSWASRDRELYELIREGRRSASVGALLLYLEDGERQVLDVLRSAAVGRSARSAAPRDVPNEQRRAPDDVPARGLPG